MKRNLAYGSIKLGSELEGYKKLFTALLPMKLHSERVPNKNFKQIGGKPLFSWMLDKLLTVDEISQIIINTDANIDLFKHYSRNPKIFIHERPDFLCGDLVSMNDIIEYDVNISNSNHFFMTHTTNPLISVNTIKSAIKNYLDRDPNINDSLYTVTRFQARFSLLNNIPVNHTPGKLLRTQDLPPVFMENSCFFIFSADSFKVNNSRVGNNPLLYETPHLESLDIDTNDDWYLAELLLNDTKVMRGKIF
jgi:CMP-N-acetylneuraminic acid synthetase